MSVGGDRCMGACLEGEGPAAGFVIEHLQQVPSALLRRTQFLTERFTSVMLRGRVTDVTVTRSSAVSLPGKCHRSHSGHCTIFQWAQGSPPSPLTPPEGDARTWTYRPLRHRDKTGETETDIETSTCLIERKEKTIGCRCSYPSRTVQQFLVIT